MLIYVTPRRRDVCRAVTLGLQFEGDETEQSEVESSKEAETEKSTSIEVVLSDSDAGDFFDVKILRDPVYGTPVFETLAGRSSCPHEQGQCVVRSLLPSHLPTAILPSRPLSFLT